MLYSILLTQSQTIAILILFDISDNVRQRVEIT